MRRKLVSCLPHKYEIRDDHFIMAAAYGVGAYFAHSPFGAAVIGTCYFIAAIVHISNDRARPMR